MELFGYFTNDFRKDFIQVSTLLLLIYSFVSWLCHLFNLHRERFWLETVNTNGKGGTTCTSRVGILIPFAFFDFVVSAVGAVLCLCSIIIAMTVSISWLYYWRSYTNPLSGALVFCSLCGLAFAYNAILLYRAAQHTPHKSLFSLVLDSDGKSATPVSESIDKLEDCTQVVVPPPKSTASNHVPISKNQDFVEKFSTLGLSPMKSLDNIDEDEEEIISNHQHKGYDPMDEE